MTFREFISYNWYWLLIFVPVYGLAIWIGWNIHRLVKVLQDMLAFNGYMFFREELEMEIYLTQSSSGKIPGYGDNNAPNGKWFEPSPGVQGMIVNGTKVTKTGQRNAKGYCEVEVVSGPYLGKVIWLEESHLFLETPLPPPPPVPAPIDYAAIGKALETLVKAIVQFAKG